MNDLRAGLLVGSTCFRCGMANKQCWCGATGDRRSSADLAEVVMSVVGRVTS